MKPIPIFLATSLLVNVALILHLAKQVRSGGVGKAQGQSAFEIRAVTNGSVVIFQGGKFFWTVRNDQLTMNVGVDRSVTFNLDPDRGIVKSIVLEIQPTNGPGYYISDIDADGIPDQRRIRGTWDKEIFYLGKFIRLFQDEGRPYVVLDGKTNELTRIDGRWVISDQPEK